MPRFTRRQRKVRRSSTPPLLNIHPNAAGIDVGSEMHMVAVPPERAQPAVRSFSSFTEDLHRLADWLTECGVDTVAMEATGVYWIPLYELLESRGFEVLLVNARHVKNVAARKTDVIDCQWLQQLHAHGLLTASFRPPDQIVALRALVRQRKILVEYASSHIQHIQKALTQMNLQLHNVISDVTGTTGMQILKAILAGERDPIKLAAMRDYSCHSDSDTIAKSLVGTWRKEHLFVLRQAVEMYEFYQSKITECDQEIERYLGRIDKRGDGGELPPSSKRKKGKPERGQPQFDLRRRLFEMTGVDLTQIPGLEAYTVLQVISEIGINMGRWKSVKHFCSWLGLAPGSRISGGKLLSSRTPQQANRAATALRTAAASLTKSKTALGAFYRRKRAQLGPAKALVATAHKLARLIYTILRDRKHFSEPGEHWYEQHFRDRVLLNLRRRAASLGFALVQQPVEGAVS